ncbi:MAG TPA: GGDEF domain-containing protein [Solirubrobacteraceae bacterium]|nr:GGDEF domain-containing protein [Solirubrobacteraceae bacterium]
MGGPQGIFAELDRERLLDMDRRLKHVRRQAFAVLLAALLLCSPWIGLWTIAPLALAALLFWLADRESVRAERPEYVIFGAWVGSEVIIAISVALTGGAQAPTMAWLAIPIVTLPARFSGRVVAVGVLVALALLLAVGFGVDAEAVTSNPPTLIAPAAVIVAVAMLSMALMQSDIEHRDECVIDELTGMLNRKALTSRVEELTQQSEVSGAPIGIVIGDLDHFKSINDTAGHAIGDAVLRDVAHRLRGQLRAFDLAYRLGGEEFVVLFPGADLLESRALAEGLRVAVADESVGDGRCVTMSFGVSASARGEIFRYRDVFAAADAALYEAKRTGRDRVCTAPARSGEHVQLPTDLRLSA